MAHTHPHNTYPTDPPRRDTIRAAISRNRTLHYPESAEALMEGQLQIPPNLQPVNRSTFRNLSKLAPVVTDQVGTYTGKRGVSRVARYLSQIDPLIITETAGISEGATLGFTGQIGPNKYYIALARTAFGQKITRYEMAGTLFHELTHAADFYCDRVDLDEYREIYEKYSHQGILDPHTGRVLLDDRIDDTELMARAFHGAFFGLPEPSQNKTEFKAKVRAWRNRYPDLVKLIERDFFFIFSE